MDHIPIVCELGINHQGSINLAFELIEMAKSCGADFVKLQKREPEASTPASQWTIPKVPPWGGEVISYIDYRKAIEFWSPQYDAIDAKCKLAGIRWFASVWDRQSLEFMRQYDVPFIKIPSAKIVRRELLLHARNQPAPVILSTGMSTLEEIDTAVETIGRNDTIILHCHSAYPCKDSEINLRVMDTLHKRYNLPVGLSSHSTSPFPSIIAAALGAKMIEVHITTDRSLPGSDHAASLERPGLELLVREVRRLDLIMGDGIKKIWPSEETAKDKLRGN